jgi:hypothetical protein
VKQLFVEFEVLTKVAKKNAIFWDVAPCESCENRRFEGTYCFYIEGRKFSEQGKNLEVGWKLLG